MSEAGAIGAKKQDYWFARRFPVGNPRNAMGPIAWQGWAAFALFTLALVAAGIMLMLFTIVGLFGAGLVVFAAVSGLSAYGLLRLVALKGDQARCIADYHLRPAAPAKEKQGG